MDKKMAEDMKLLDKSIQLNTYGEQPSKKQV